MITSGSIYNPTNKDYSYSSNVPLEYHYDSSYLDQPLKNGDTLTIEIPAPLTVKNGDTFDIKDDDGNVIGSAVLTPGSNNLVITFNEEVEKLDHVSGDINLDGCIGIDKDKGQIGQNDVNFPTVNGNQTSDLIIRPSSENDISKKGVLGTDEDGNAIVTWTILANRNELNLKELSVTDIMKDSNLEPIDMDSIVVQKAVWKDKDTGVYSRKDVVDNYTVTPSGNGFTLDFNNPEPNQMYAIRFQTKLKDPSQATDGTVFKNSASMEASYGGSGSGGGVINGNTSASVSGNSNSGSGNGNKKGSVILTKKSSDDANVPLQGAVYSLYKQGLDTPIQTGLTTDANGQISVSDLVAGDYYFVETTPPAGYSKNPNEIPFTITGQTTSAVYVSTMDETEESKEGSIIIQKLDSETGWKLPGAEFEVTNDEGVVVGTITTDQLGYGHLYNLPYGTYTLKETKSPDGYLLNDKEIKVTVGDNDQTPAIISFENEKIDGIDGGNNDDYFSASMIKYDADYPEQKIGVPGAEYTLYKEDGTPLSVYTTNENGVITVENLVPGNYYFVETKAPDDYDINTEPITFSITDKDIDLNDENPLVTSDPSLNEGNEKPNPDPDPDGNGGNEGNEGNGNNEKPGTDGNGGNGGGVITDPNNPGSNNNSSNGGGLITDPVNPGTSNNGSSSSNNSNSTLPQTGSKSGYVFSVLGLFLLTGIFYIKRRHA